MRDEQLIGGIEAEPGGPVVLRVTDDAWLETPTPLTPTTRRLLPISFAGQSLLLLSPVLDDLDSVPGWVVVVCTVLAMALLLGTLGWVLWRAFRLRKRVAWVWRRVYLPAWGRRVPRGSRCYAVRDVSRVIVEDRGLPVTVTVTMADDRSLRYSARSRRVGRTLVRRFRILGDRVSQS